MKRLMSALTIVVAVTAGVVPAAHAQDRTLGGRVDDATITAAVKAKLVAERASSAVAVDIDTRDGVVHLQGTVPTEQDRTNAEQLARATHGVRDVKNDLDVSSRASDTSRETTPATSPRTR